MRKWILTAGLVGVTAFLVLSPSYDRPSDLPDEEQTNQIQPLSVQQEMNMKQAVIERDVSLTDELCRKQCSRDLRQFLSNNANRKHTELEQAAHHFRVAHPYMRYMAWHMEGKTSFSGKIPPEAKKKALPHLSQATASALKGKHYLSPNFTAGKETYYAIGLPLDGGKKFVTALVQRQLQGDIAIHQRKNLRVVPYPSDKRFKIQAADSDDLEKRRVDHPEENEGTSHYYVSQVVVRFKQEPSPQALEQMKQETGAISAKKLGYTYVFESKSMNMEELKKYFQNKGAAYTEPHYLYMTNENSPDFLDNPNDELYEPYQWNLPAIHTVQGWEIAKGAKEIIVAVIDTGVDLDHPDLQGRLVEGINIVNEQLPPEDDVGHGTHVAGVIAAGVNNVEGIAGLSWYNRIMPIKVLDETGAGNTYNVAAGIIWAVDHGANVINLSLGNYAEAQFLHDAVRYAYDHDVVLIAATGNDNTEQPGYPAAYPEVFAVGATNQAHEKAIFSNYGSYLDVAAPGENIASTYMAGRYAALSGTSMASPHVAALAAILRAANPSLRADEVMEVMRRSATDLGKEGHDAYFGFGQIDIQVALQQIQQNTDRLSLFLYPEQLEQELSRLRTSSFSTQ
ncbi:S8 family peptidase [Marinicrinis sediminis]|uniref:S8 family peptidase n=1 Tax=Marinicrinis sediminis TaxID=1652465 RepID=A0ABW5RBP4_9BACL